jgi:hypothetical protein
VIDQVNTNSIVLVQSRSNLQLGADPVNAGYQSRLFVPLEFKKPSKEPDATQDLGAEGRPGMLGNQLLSLSGSININPSFSVGLAN